MTEKSKKVQKIKTILKIPKNSILFNFSANSKIFKKIRNFGKNPNNSKNSEKLQYYLPLVFIFKS